MKKIFCSYLVVAIIMALTGVAAAFEFRGFGDVTFKKVSGSSEETNRYDSFVLGDVDLYISEQIDDRLDILGEILLELEEEEADVERFHVGYMFSDAIKIRVGRFHTPLGFWNTSFHHGTQLQPSIDRPEILKFESEGGILPVHTVGFNATGRYRTGASVFIYDLMIGNGGKIKKNNTDMGELSPNVKSDDNYNKSVAFSLAVKPGITPGLKIGFSGDILRVQSEKDIAENWAPVDVEQTIITPAFLYHINGLKIWGEYFYIRNKEKGTSDEKTSNGYYMLLTYTFKDQWIPYILHERRNIDKEDSYFRALIASDIAETIAGLRYNISYRSCIKIEGRSIYEDHDHYGEYATQWAISF